MRKTTSAVEFNSPFNKEEYIRSNKILWTYSWQNAKKQIIRWTGMSVIFFGIEGWMRVKEYESTLLFVFLGIIYFGIAAFTGLQMFFSWIKYKKKVQESANKYEQAVSEYSLRLSDEGVEFSDFQASINIKWSAFKYFTLFKGYVILIPYSYIAGGLLIDKNNEEQYKIDQALSILEENLTEKY